MYIMFTQYTKYKMRNYVNGPSHAEFLETLSISNLCKKADLVVSLEKIIEDVRTKALAILTQTMELPMARLQVAVFIDMILRCVMSKPWAANMPLKVPVGKYSEGNA